MSLGGWAWLLHAVGTSPVKSLLDELTEPTDRPPTDSRDNEMRYSCEKGAGKMKEAGGWHALIPGQITRPEGALAFLNACGFCTWGPVPRLSFPNLAEAMGETATSVLDRTWSWKDDLHFEQKLHYCKIIAGQPSFLAPDHLPDFISALAGRGLEHERDVSRLYFKIGRAHV